MSKKVNRTHHAAFHMCVLFLTTGIALSCQSNRTSQRSELQGTSYAGWGFCLTLPDDCNVEKGGIHDFDTYNITKGDMNMLFIYAGFHPSFPKYIPNEVKKGTRKTHGKKSTGAAWHEGNLQSAEYLIQLHPDDIMFKSNSPKPTFLHCIFTSLDAENAFLANSMIDSIRIVDSEK